MAGLLDRLDDSLDIKGLDGAEVDDLSLNTVLLLELLSSSQGLANAAGEGDDGEVLARTLDLSLAELFPLLEIMSSFLDWGSFVPGGRNHPSELPRSWGRKDRTEAWRNLAIDNYR